jgi:hypothetical protein
LLHSTTYQLLGESGEQTGGWKRERERERVEGREGRGGEGGGGRREEGSRGGGGGTGVLAAIRSFTILPSPFTLTTICLPP